MSHDTYSTAWHQREAQLFTRTQRWAKRRCRTRALCGVTLQLAAYGTTDRLAGRQLSTIKQGRAVPTQFALSLKQRRDWGLA